MDFTNSINPLYAYEAVRDQMKSSFKSSKPSVLLLTDFLTKKAVDGLLLEIKQEKKKELYVPHMYRYELFDAPEAATLFSSSAFFTFVRDISGIKPSNVSLSTALFKHRFYTLLHDDVDDSEQLIFFYTLCPKTWDPSWGGQTIFTFGDEREPLIFDPKANSLVVLKVPKGMRPFVKYLKHSAASNELVKITGRLR